MIKLGVIFGGESVEHEVSIISACQAMYKMDAAKYDVIPIYINKQGEWYTGECLKDLEIYKDMDLLKRNATRVVLYRKDGRFVLQSLGFFKREVNNIDLAFTIVHCTNVEDGVLQGYLMTVGVPFAGPEVYAAVLGQDKVFMKQVFEADDLPIVKYEWFFDHEYLDDPKETVARVAKKLGYPIIVKPSKLGSSVGISVAHNEDELVSAIEEAITYDEKILCEEVVENLKEVNIAVLGSHEKYEVSEIEEVSTSKDFLSYEEKYIGDAKKGKGGTITSKKGQSAHKIPANISKELKEEIEEVALKAARSLNAAGNSRFDFMINTKTNKVYINEVNSIPGSLAFYLWEPLNKDYTELLDDMVNIGVREYKKRTNKVHTFDTNILEGYQGGVKGFKGGKGKLK